MIQDWRCHNDTGLPCPPEGCPVMRGCAREHGWPLDAALPAGYSNVQPLENLVSRRAENIPPRPNFFVRIASNPPIPPIPPDERLRQFRERLAETEAMLQRVHAEKVELERKCERLEMELAEARR